MPYTFVPPGATTSRTAAEVVEAGAARGESCADTALRSDVIITMLPDGPEVEAAVLGPLGVLEGARAGSVVVDMSSISPIVAQKVAAACAAKGVDFLDAPVSGGEPKAIDGTLAIMVGGKADVFESLRPFLGFGSDPAQRYEEIAAGMGTPVGTLKNQVFRLRKRWRELLFEQVAMTLDEPTPDEIRGELKELLGCV